MYHTVIFFMLFCGVYSQVINVGECPQVEFIKDFDATKYVGKWYEIERYPVIFEFMGKCVTAEYSARQDDAIGVHNEQIHSLIGNKQAIDGVAYYDGPHSEGKLSVVFPGFLGSNMRGAYWILGTDYSNYAVVWSCTKLGNLHFIASWILARESNPSADVMAKAYEVVDNNKINRSHYFRTDQVNCPENH